MLDELFHGHHRGEYGEPPRTPGVTPLHGKPLDEDGAIVFSGVKASAISQALERRRLHKNRLDDARSPYYPNADTPTLPNGSYVDLEQRDLLTLADSVEGLSSALGTEQTMHAAWRKRAEEAERELDPPVCRLQFPDGSVPGNVREAAEGWKRWAVSRGVLVGHFLAVLTHKEIRPPMSDGIQKELAEQCRAALTAGVVNQELTTEELTELFYEIRFERNKLLWACEKALKAYDAAHELGKGSWRGEDVDEMRAAVAECHTYDEQTTPYNEAES